jgi:hypothetical protein
MTTDVTGEAELVLVVDCADLDRAARFWCGVLGYTALQPFTR